MKKTSKILSGSLLVALMAFGLVKGNPVEKTGGLQVRDVLAEDVTKDVAGRIVRKADGEAPAATGKVSEVKAQVSEEVEGKRHIRFVAAIDSYAYDAGYFDVTFKNGEEVVKTWADQRVSYVYEAIEVEGEALTPTDLFAKNTEEYASFEGCNYFIAFTVNNVPQAYWETTIEVSASVTSGETVYEKVAEKTVQEVIDADNPVVELTPFHARAYNGNYFEVFFLQTELPAVKDLTVNSVTVSGSTDTRVSNKYDGGWNGLSCSIFQIYTNIQNNSTGLFEISLNISDNDEVTYTSEFSILDGAILTLAGYQKIKISELNSYCSNMGYVEALYTEVNWSNIETILENARTNINAATSYVEIDSILVNAYAAIDAVEQKKVTYHTVNFYNGDRLVKTVEVIEGESILEFPSDPGYDISGWYTTNTFDEGTEVAVPIVVSAPLNIYAKTEVATAPELKLEIISSSGAWFKLKIEWPNGYAFTQDNITLQKFGTHDCNRFVGAATYTGNSITIGVGTAGGDVSFGKDVTLTFKVTIDGVSYNVSSLVNVSAKTVHSTEVTFA